MRSPLLPLLLLTAAAACGEDLTFSSAPDLPDDQKDVIEEIRVCVDRAMDWSHFLATGVMPKTGESPEAALRIGDFVIDTTLPPRARVRFLISNVIDNADIPVIDDVELMANNGNRDSTPEVAYFHEDGVTPYNENSKPLENCEEVRYFDITPIEWPKCLCDRTGNGCYVQGDKSGPDPDDISNYYCENPEDFICYVSEKSDSIGRRGAVCHTYAEEN